MSSNLIPGLLIIEDSDEDFEAICRILRQASINNPIFRCVDGEDALEFLYQTGCYQAILPPRPSIIVLDLNLPGTDGREVLSQIKQDRELGCIPIVVLTTSSNPKDIEECYRNGANSYILKPIDIGKLVDTIQTFVHYWLDIVSLPDAVERLP